ncbi:MAG TPA: PAS domain-containing protein [Acidimicrobiales bacterium]|nr:PAS domain-containing protein [Acidimicrobiales bacterium]
MPMDVDEGAELPLEEVLDYFHPADKVRVLAMLESVSRDGSAAFNYTARTVTADGPREASAFVQVIRDEKGEAIRLLGRRVPHHDLKPSSIESIAVGYWTRDLRTGVFTGDAGFCSIFGVEPVEPDLREAVFGRFHPDEVDHARSFVANTVAARKTRARSTHRLLALDGSFRWVTTDLRIEYDENGIAIMALGTVMGFN